MEKEIRNTIDTIISDYIDETLKSGDTVDLITKHNRLTDTISNYVINLVNEIQHLNDLLNECS